LFSWIAEDNRPIQDSVFFVAVKLEIVGETYCLQLTGRNESYSDVEVPK
jgi:hypothetical protein